MSGMRLIDMHIHSDNSPDGTHSPMFMCEYAVRNGLRAAAFTDHCEIDKFFEQKYNSSVFHSYFECVKARNAFEGQLLVLIGLEIGQPLHNVDLSNKVINSKPYDYILGSVHTPRGQSLDIKEMEFDKLDIYKFMEDYFLELAEIAQWNGCDALAHLTCPIRHIQGRYNIDFDFSKISEVTDFLLETMIKNGKALEINTSGLRQSIGITMPDENIIKRYRELGGTLITIGSDSHNAYDVGAGIEKGMSIAKKCGFDKVTFYVNREAMQIEI